MCNRRGRGGIATIVLTVSMSLLAGTGRMDAICNLIPGTAKTFNSTLGATNRPFAAPGERVELRVRPCDTTSAGLTADGKTGIFKAKGASAPAVCTVP